MTTHPYWLHYAGGRVYDKPERFIREARRLGVARAMPKTFLRAMSFGDAVLVGNWTPRRCSCDLVDRRRGVIAFVEAGSNAEWRPNPACAKHGTDRDALEGFATVFAGFRLTGVNVNASEAARAAMHKRLKIVDVEVLEEPRRVERECGGYSIVVVAHVSNTIEEVVKAAQEVEVETGEPVKLFMTCGPEHVREIGPPYVTLDPAKFTRTVLRVDIEDGSMASGVTVVGESYRRWDDDLAPLNPAWVDVNFVMDYSSRRYVPKKLREKLYGEAGGAVRP